MEESYHISKYKNSFEGEVCSVMFHSKTWRLINLFSVTLLATAQSYDHSKPMVCICKPYDETPSTKSNCPEETNAKKGTDEEYYYEDSREYVDEEEDYYENASEKNEEHEYEEEISGDSGGSEMPVLKDNSEADSQSNNNDEVEQIEIEIDLPDGNHFSVGSNKVGFDTGHSGDNSGKLAIGQSNAIEEAEGILSKLDATDEQTTAELNQMTKVGRESISSYKGASEESSDIEDGSKRTHSKPKTNGENNSKEKETDDSRSNAEEIEEDQEPVEDNSDPIEETRLPSNGNDGITENYSENEEPPDVDDHELDMSTQKSINDNRSEYDDENLEQSFNIRFRNNPEDKVVLGKAEEDKSTDLENEETTLDGDFDQELEPAPQMPDSFIHTTLMKFKKEDFETESEALEPVGKINKKPLKEDSDQAPVDSELEEEEEDSASGRDGKKSDVNGSWNRDTNSDSTTDGSNLEGFTKSENNLQAVGADDDNYEEDETEAYLTDESSSKDKTWSGDKSESGERQEESSKSSSGQSMMRSILKGLIRHNLNQKPNEPFIKSEGNRSSTDESDTSYEEEYENEASRAGEGNSTRSSDKYSNSEKEKQHEASSSGSGSKNAESSLVDASNRGAKIREEIELPITNHLTELNEKNDAIKDDENGEEPDFVEVNSTRDVVNKPNRHSGEFAGKKEAKGDTATNFSEESHANARKKFSSEGAPETYHEHRSETDEKIDESSFDEIIEKEENNVTISSNSVEKPKVARVDNDRRAESNLHESLGANSATESPTNRGQKKTTTVNPLKDVNKEITDSNSTAAGAEGEEEEEKANDTKASEPDLKNTTEKLDESSEKPIDKISTKDGSESSPPDKNKQSDSLSDNDTNQNEEASAPGRNATKNKRVDSKGAYSVKCRPSKNIAFIGINGKGKVEIVSHSPLNEKCWPPKFNASNSNIMISDLNGTIYVYDGNHGISNLSKDMEWRHVIDLKEKRSEQAPLTFSDGSWWFTGGVLSDTSEASEKTTFFDPSTPAAQEGKPLGVAQAGHCMIEVAKSFVASGGATKDNATLNGFTQRYDILNEQAWGKVGSMVVPRKGHSCVSINTPSGELLMVVGGIDGNGTLLQTAEIFSPSNKTWSIDEKHKIPFPTKRPQMVTIGCKVYLIANDKDGFGAVYILTEKNWRRLRNRAKFSSDMDGGFFSSSSLHCSDLPKEFKTE